MTVQRITSSLQQDLLALLAYNDIHGKIIASIVEPTLFEGDLRVIAERCISYWNQYREAPKAHTVNLVAEITEDKSNRRAPTFRQILHQLYQLSEAVNAKYALDQVRRFMRTQRLKEAILEAAEKLNQKQEHAIEEVEVLFSEILQAREIDFEPGLYLSDYKRVLNYLQNQYVEFKTGIKELDNNYVVPYRGAAMLILGAAGKGKTWMAVQIGKEALLQRHRVLHITPEMSEEEIAQRYYQGLWAITKRDKKSQVVRIELDRSDRISGLEPDEVIPDFTFASPNIRDEFEIRIGRLGGARYDNVLVKRFPTGQLTPTLLRAYLDSLEVVEHFIPDMVIVENIGLMKTEIRDHRIHLGRNFVGIRGLAIERNFALVVSHQISREGAEALMAKTTHVGEDWSLIGTADLAIVYSCTDSEARYGLGRLFVGKARNEKDRYGVLLSQSYATGQFVLESAMLNDKYFDFLNGMSSGGKDSKEDPGDDQDND
jgi:hypothetical protein